MLLMPNILSILRTVLIFYVFPLYPEVQRIELNTAMPWVVLFNSCLSGVMAAMKLVYLAGWNRFMAAPALLWFWRFWRIPCSREYCMIYRGPGFLVVVWFLGSSSPLPSVSKLDRRRTLRKRDNLLMGEGGGGGGRSQIIRRLESLVLY